MNDPWTCDLYRIMHVYRITQRDLMAELHMSEQYVSDVMRGKRPSTEKTQAKFKAALNEIVKRKEASDAGIR